MTANSGGAWRLLIALLFVVACAACGRQRAEAPATAVAPAEPTAYEFLVDVIRSLEQCERGVRQGWAGDTQTDIVELMTANKNATIAIGQADVFLRTHASSQDTTRGKAATAIMEGFAMLRRSLEIQLECYERVDTATTQRDLAGLNRMMSDGKVAQKQGSLMLMHAAGLAFGSVLVPAVRYTGNYMALNMSEGDRAGLVAAIDSLFGDAPRRHGDMTGPVAAARVLREALDQQWRVAKP